VTVLPARLLVRSLVQADEEQRAWRRGDERQREGERGERADGE
jgi:hypothetical protein